MIVVPLVMFSMIVGITGLGDIRNLGPIGGRTVLYYMVTTGISVLIGLILVNIIQPGKGISRGADHPEYTYTVGGENNRTVTLTNGTWENTRFDDRYALILTDQECAGRNSVNDRKLCHSKVVGTHPRRRGGLYRSGGRNTPAVSARWRPARF